MDLPVDSLRLTGSQLPITVWDAKRITSQRANPFLHHLCQIIDDMGTNSKLAQGLNTCLTSLQRLRDCPAHRLYLLCSEKKCVGILKVGTKKLFIRNRSGSLLEMEPLCVLDFYIHESEQRGGCGRMLFDYMLASENIMPHKLGIDRPSPKLLGFLRKHFQLSDFVPQTNNFVVFNKYFEVEGNKEEHCPSRGNNDIGPISSSLPVLSNGSRRLEQTTTGQRCGNPSVLLPPSRGPPMIISPSTSTTTSLQMVKQQTLTRLGSQIQHQCTSSSNVGEGGYNSKGFSTVSVSNPKAPHSVDQRGGGPSAPVGSSFLSTSTTGRRVPSPTRSAVDYDILNFGRQSIAATTLCTQPRRR